MFDATESKKLVNFNLTNRFYSVIKTKYGKSDYFCTVETNVSEITHIVFMTHNCVKKRHPHIVSIFTW